VVFGSRTLWLLPFLTLSAVIGHIALVPAQEEGVSASLEAQRRIGEKIRRKEPKLRRAALERWPGSPWSAGDDFGNREEDFVRDMSNEESVRPGAVFDAIDRDIKAYPGDGERGAVAPCMPRPFYD
jgi:hypothetical protein